MRIGVLLTADYGWAGGMYYSLTCVKLLQKISLQKKLEIVVFVNRNTAPELLPQIQLPNIRIHRLEDKPLSYKIMKKLSGILTGSDRRFVSDINSEHLDILFPVIHYNRSHKLLNCTVYYWLYDFQHKFLPSMFSIEEIVKRDHNFEMITRHASHIVLSSQDSRLHLQQFYPRCKATFHVYRFVSLVMPGPDSQVNSKFKDYFIVCNQFWPHKNHLVVLKAILELKRQNNPVNIVFTGKHDLVQNADYVSGLMNFISENGLSSNVQLTGFLGREEQINLMVHAKAVIQPSKFEGWSTVVEDAKALNKIVVASDLPIHREQLGENACYFSIDDHSALAGYLRTVNEGGISFPQTDYNSKIENSIRDLIGMFKIN